MDQQLGTFVNSLFDRSRVWGLTTSTTVTDFVASLCLVSSDSTMM